MGVTIMYEMPNHLNEEVSELKKTIEAIAADIDNAGITSFL